MKNLKDSTKTRITLKDVIDVLCRYDVRHLRIVGNPFNETELHGLCDDYSKEKVIETLLSLLDGRGSYKEEEHYKFMENLINKKIKKIKKNGISEHNSRCCSFCLY